MNTLAPPSGPAQRPGEPDGLRPPAPTQAAVPHEFASLTWPADVAVSELPAPAVSPAPSATAFPAPAWAAPSASGEAPSSTDGTGWNWTPVMGDGAAAPRLRTPGGDLSIELSALEAVFDAREHAAAPDDQQLDDGRAEEDVAMPSVSFEPAHGTVTTAAADADTALVTATVPAFVTYAPSTGYVLPAAPPREPVVVEVREAIVSLPPQRRARPRRSGRAGVVLIVFAAAISAAAYLGFREYIYGDADVADDGTRVVEVEPSRTVVVLDGP